MRKSKVQSPKSKVGEREGARRLRRFTVRHFDPLGTTRMPRILRACPRINFVGSLCRKLCRNTPLFLQNSTKFATKAADKEPKGIGANAASLRRRITKFVWF